ncbi:MAG: ABC transporter ATP-binding protein [Clostridiales bacterium]|nr:ABC transporter ATP-binding protein [Clostridiales bacterium]
MENVCKIYDKGRVCALRDVTLEIARGDYVSVMGASGSGKSTLMHILGCLDRPTSGVYRFDGVDVSRLSAAGRARLRGTRIGFVFQSFGLVPGMDALENAALPLTFQGVPRAERLSRAADALCMVGLGARLRHPPAALSGGQQQRVAIARALAADPDVLLADEPTGNLDPDAAGEILDLFDRLSAAGRTIVCITHDPAAAARAGRHILIKSGKICPETGGNDP